MSAQVFTAEDMELFKQDLLAEIRKMLSERQDNASSKWLKATHVRRLLNISPGTLQHLRVSGALPFSKIGGVIFYHALDIEKMFNERKTDARSLRKLKSK